MAALPVTNPTLLDLANRMDPNGKIPDIVELLHQQNEILDDMVWKEGNLPTGHKTKTRTGLPTPTWRRLNQGVMATRSETADITETCGFMEAYSKIDKKEMDLNGNTAAFRLSEDAAHLEGMNQSLATTLFYGDETVDPQKFTGFAPRMTDNTAEYGENMIDGGGGTGADNASIWLVGWGDNTIFGIIPKGMPAGFQHTDKGMMTVPTHDASGAYTGDMEAYVSHYSWDTGLCVKDWRYLVRIPNVDKTALTKNAASGADILDLMTIACETIHSLSNVRPVFYVPRTIRSWMRRQIVSKVASSTLTMGEVAGKPVTMFDNIPVRRCDALAGDEADITFS